MEFSLAVIAHNIRSAHNVGSLMRTCEGLGVAKLYLTGYTPYPSSSPDSRLPHIAQKLDNQIHKTALGAELSLDWKYQHDIYTVLSDLKKSGYKICALEQNNDSIRLSKFKYSGKLAMLLGSEVAGIDQDLLKECDYIIEIPMKGKKESFNVVEAASMAMYHCVYGIVN